VRTEGIFLDVQVFDGRFGEYATNRVGELFVENPGGRLFEQLEVGVRDVRSGGGLRFGRNGSSDPSSRA